MINGDDDDAGDDAIVLTPHRAVTLPWLAKDLNIPDNKDAGGEKKNK